MLDEKSRMALASRAVYTGSEEHKEERSWLGLPKPRRGFRTSETGFKQNATICPLVKDEEREIATGWVREAIRLGHYNKDVLDGEFPREIWHRDSHGQYWFGRLTQRGAGDESRAEYKGWPVTREEWRANFD